MRYNRVACTILHHGLKSEIMEHVDLHGSAREMGRQHGHRLAGLIPQVIRHYRPHPDEPSPAMRAAAYRIERALLGHCPNVVEEMRGIAEGAGVSYEDILLLNVQGDAEGDLAASPAAPTVRCTAIGLPATPEGPLVAKTDDVGSDARGFETWFRARPEDGYPFMCNAFAGMAANQGGLNAAGLALVMTGLLPAGRRDHEGIPSLLFLRQALQECATVEEALAFAGAHPLRGYACSMTMADARSAAVTVVENYPAGRAVRRSMQPTVRTNHPQCAESPAMSAEQARAAGERWPGLLANSLARAENAARLVREIPRSTAGLQRLLADHGEPGAICQHGQAGLHTSVAMIVIPHQRVILAADGYGCEPYRTWRVCQLSQ